MTFVTADSGLAISVNDIGMNKVISKRLLPEITFMPQCTIAEIDTANVTITLTYEG